MTSIMILSSLLILICLQNSVCVYFCDVKSFDTVFNLGHLIYFGRCGEMWAFNPRKNSGDGLLFGDSSPMIIGRSWFGEDIVRMSDNPNFLDRTKVNVSGFSFQELSCVGLSETSRVTCQLSVEHWQHLTFLIGPLWMYAFKYDTVFIPKSDGVLPLQFKFQEDLTSNAINQFWPLLTDIAPEHKFDVKKMAIKYLLYDPHRFYLYLAVTHEEYVCVTYLYVKDMLFNVQYWPALNAPDKYQKLWMSANCFVGLIHGMFIHRTQAYIVGTVLYEDRQFDDQLYKMLANGRSRVEFQLIYNQKKGSNESEPQTLRQYFGCSAPKKPNNSRKKRSIEDPIQTNQSKAKVLAKRVANNVLIQIMFTFLVLVLVYRLVYLRLRARYQNKIDIKSH